MPVFLVFNAYQGLFQENFTTAQAEKRWIIPTQKVTEPVEERNQYSFVPELHVVLIIVVSLLLV